MHVHAGLTNKSDDIESGVGEDRCIGLIQVVVRLFLASDGFPGDTDGRSIGQR